MTDTFSRPILMADNSPLRMLTRTTGSGSSKLKTISLPSWYMTQEICLSASSVVRLLISCPSPKRLNSF